MRSSTRRLFMCDGNGLASSAGRLFQGVHVVLDVGPDAFADRNGLQLRQPRVPLIAGLEQWCGSQRCAGGRRLADAVVRHEDQRAVVGLQRESHVEPVTAVSAVGNPVAGRYLHRGLEPWTFEPPADDLDDRAGALWPVLDDRTRAGLNLHRPEILKAWCRRCRLLRTCDGWRCHECGTNDQSGCKAHSSSYVRVMRFPARTVANGNSRWRPVIVPL